MPTRLRNRMNNQQIKPRASDATSITRVTRHRSMQRNPCVRSIERAATVRVRVVVGGVVEWRVADVNPRQHSVVPGKNGVCYINRGLSCRVYHSCIVLLLYRSYVYYSIRVWVRGFLWLAQHHSQPRDCVQTLTRVASPHVFAI
jgi:hypothetical protein